MIDKDEFLSYLILQKEKEAKNQNFQRAAEWRTVEKLYRQFLLLNNDKPIGSYISIEDVVNLFLSKEKPKPLFTTNDGVEIFEGGNCWIVEDDKESEPFEWRDVCNGGMYGHQIYFSTKEKAEEYILLNKPLLSVSDICKLTSVYGKPMVNFEKDVIRLAKDKLQGK